MPYVIAGCAFAAFAFFSVLRDKKGSYAALGFKTLLSLLFLAVSLCCLYYNARLSVHLFALIFGGQICALFGDVLLDLKVIKREVTGRYLYAGMSCFSLCQIFYVAALTSLSGVSPYPFIAAACLSPLVLLIAYGGKIRLKNAFWNASLYAFLLSLTLAQSVYLYVLFANPFSLLLFTGALCFFLSDGVLMLTYFRRMDSRPMIVINHFLYYAGQFLIAFSLLFAS